ncbi:hypothetical protein EQG73_02460 [Clostridium tetani]|nr:hypothetical protein EQG73_02460 [Clostridium tetani]QBD86574.1 hypothetical protein EW636_02460 [Clostridium tetani]
MENKIKGFNKKIVALIMIASISVAGIGCSSKKGDASSNKDNRTKQEESVKKDVEVKEKEDPKNKIEKDEKLTNKIKKEKIVSDGQVYEQGEYVYATLIIKEDAKKEEIDKVANEYAKKLKSEHKDKKVSVQAVQGGKNVADITLK